MISSQMWVYHYANMYENNTPAVRLLYSLSVLQSTITFEAQGSLCTLRIAKSLDGPDLYALGPELRIPETQEEAI